jgi:hypothetical protein
MFRFMDFPPWTFGSLAKVVSFGDVGEELAAGLVVSACEAAAASWTLR